MVESVFKKTKQFCPIKTQCWIVNVKPNATILETDRSSFLVNPSVNFESCIPTPAVLIKVKVLSFWP